MKRVSRVGLNSGESSKEKELHEQGRQGQGSFLLWERERRGEAVRAESRLLRSVTGTRKTYRAFSTCQMTMVVSTVSPRTAL